MLQSQSLPEKLKCDSPIYDTIIGTPPPASPYSRRYPVTRVHNNDNAIEETTLSSSPVIFTFESLNGSPYSRRIPVGEKRVRNDEYEHKANWSVESSIQGGFDPKDIQDIDDMQDIQDVALPIEMHRYQSMQSLRHRRDPHFQGNRTRKSKRVVDKTGERNIDFINIPQRGCRFFKDFVTTLIDEQWRYVVTVFALSYFACWILFAILWYLIAHAHGDLNIDPVTGKRLSDGPVPCVEGCHNFAGFLLFSIETCIWDMGLFEINIRYHCKDLYYNIICGEILRKYIVSIGYGNKYPNEQCPEAIFLMIVQVIIGILIEGAMVGIVYAKMIQPPKHVSDMNFSKKAVICQRNSKLCLLFRVCDTKNSHVIDSKIEAYWFEERYSLEGEKLKHFQHTLKLENRGRVFLIFPSTICHVIDETSPLYDMSARDLLEKKFELIVTLTGSSRTTGQMTQSRISFLPKEIMWGNRFANMIVYNRSQHSYEVDYDKFDEVIEFYTPLCSARRLDEVIYEVKEFFYHDMGPDYYGEHLNYIGDGSITEAYETVSVLGQMPGTSGTQSVQRYTIENSQNERNDMRKLAVDLESKLSQHSLNLLAQSIEINDAKKQFDK